MSHSARDNLHETWRVCRQALAWLIRSHEKSPPPPYGNVNEDDWDQLEALAGRFARLTDLTIHKVFRALDKYELEDAGSLVDSSNRAVKRGLIDSVDTVRDFKDLRNEIVHEYALDDLAGLYEEIYHATPEIINLVHRIGEYLAERCGIAEDQASKRKI